MTRYAADHKTDVRRRIVTRASRRVRASGIDGAGVAGIMQDAGLTNGAFYSHFRSKDELVAEVLAVTLDEQAASIEGLGGDRAAAEAFIRAYLSPEHRDDRSGGCPSAALLADVDRGSESIRSTYARHAERIVAVTERQLTAIDPVDARSRAIALYSLLVGSLQLARAITDPAASERVLEAGRQQAILLLTSNRGGGAR